MAGSVWHDEDGVEHCHDPNITTQYYICEHGHRFQIGRKHSAVNRGGSSGVLEYRGANCGSMVCCRKCGATGPPENTGVRAIEAWNSAPRNEPTIKDAERKRTWTQPARQYGKTAMLDEKRAELIGEAYGRGFLKALDKKITSRLIGTLFPTLNQQALDEIIKKHGRAK
jgi:hypothetical protein